MLYIGSAIEDSWAQVRAEVVLEELRNIFGADVALDYDELFGRQVFLWLVPLLLMLLLPHVQCMCFVPLETAQHLTVWCWVHTSPYLLNFFSAHWVVYVVHCSYCASMARASASLALVWVGHQCNLLLLADKP